jgi:uncharacterized repeat protein (TIGR03803 family)
MKPIRLCALASLAAACVTILPAQPAQGQPYTETVLHSFCGRSNCADGANPYTGLIRDSSGNLYGTTFQGGSGCDSYGCGVLFKVDTTGVETVLYNFKGGSDGRGPNGVVQDAQGNLYGTTHYGGTGNCKNGPPSGCGVVFKLGQSGQETVLHTFTGRADGGYPEAGVWLASNQDLYGTTEAGGSGNCKNAPPSGCGVVFKVSQAGKETVLHTFCLGEFGDCSDGASPLAGVIQDGQGNLYGTTVSGGSHDGCEGCGVVFELGKTGVETVLHTFCPGGGRCTDGANPYAGLIRDAHGNLYGTTEAGGANGAGAVFKLSQSRGKWKETVLYSFCPGGGTCTDGGFPWGGLIQDSKGNVYGTTEAGGTGCGGAGCGTVFELSNTGGKWTETVLYSFCSQSNCTDGAGPSAGVIQDAQGNLYGTTYGGGPNGGGVVFKLTP